MKQTAKRLALLSIVALALTSCELSFNPFASSSFTNSDSSTDSSGDNSSSSGDTASSSDDSSSSNGGTSSTSSGTSSGTSSKSSSSTSSGKSSSSSSSSSTKPALPEPGDITANKTTGNYKSIAHNNPFGSCSTPSTGKAKILVIPIWFENDSPNYIAESKKETVRSDIEKAYFGTNEETGWRSVKTFYEEESQGALTLTGTVSEWYVETRSASVFGPESSGNGYTTSLVTTVTNWYFSNHTDESRSAYDKDGDGFLDGVMLIYAYPDSTFLSGDYGNFWAYCFWTTKSASLMNPVPNQYFWASYDFMYSWGDTARAHTGKSELGSGHTDHCAIDAHTFIHEMGHMYGLSDYYDYSGRYVPAGGFSMQDHNIGGHDAFSVLALGWGKAYIPTETININLKPMQSSGEMILLTPSWNSYNSPFDEYLLLEYYTSTGLNKFDTDYQYGYYEKGSSKAGIRLWHVDARLAWYDSRGQAQVETNPNKSGGYGVTTGITNTYNYNGVDSARLARLGSAYYNYNLLQIIHNDKTISTSKNKRLFSEDSLFLEGDSFSMGSFGGQFYHNSKMNTNTDLGFTFTVNGLTSDFASITVTKI